MNSLAEPSSIPPSAGCFSPANLPPPGTGVVLFCTNARACAYQVQKHQTYCTRSPPPPVIYELKTDKGEKVPPLRVEAKRAALSWLPPPSCKPTLHQPAPSARRSGFITSWLGSTKKSLSGITPQPQQAATAKASAISAIWSLPPCVRYLVFYSKRNPHGIIARLRVCLAGSQRKIWNVLLNLFTSSRTPFPVSSHGL